MKLPQAHEMLKTKPSRLASNLDRRPDQRIKRTQLNLVGGLVGSLVAYSVPLVALAAEGRDNPQEARVAQIAKSLKPIDDEKWKEIVGPRLEEHYTIAEDDTLFDISKRLFGDPKYWPKIWAINNSGITNPHLIYAGNSISFFPGSGSTLPSVRLADAGFSPTAGRSMSDVSRYGPNRSKEWQALEKQPWENIQIALPAEVDPSGFDNRSKISFVHRSNGYSPNLIPSTHPIVPLGKIVGARTEGTYLSPYDTIFIEGTESLKVGEVYGITKAPFEIKDKEEELVGYSYEILGKVLIESVSDQTFTGTLIEVRNFLPRESILVECPKKIVELNPIPGPSPVRGLLYLDLNNSSSNTAQFREVFVDRGSEEGVKPGMVFRAYQYKDPTTKRTLTDADQLKEADILITQVSEKLSTGIIMYGRRALTEFTPVVLLTDLEDVGKRKNKNSADANPPKKEGDVEHLDQYQDNDSLTKSERRTLKQLENWKGNPKENLKENTAGSPKPTPAPEGSENATPSEAPPPTPPNNQEPSKSAAPEPTPAPSTDDLAPPPAAEPIAPPPPPPTESTEAAGDSTLPPANPMPDEGAIPPPPLIPPPPK